MGGYRMTRATHGVSKGTYYYEVLILDPKDGGGDGSEATTSTTTRDVVKKLPDVVRLGDGLKKTLVDGLVAEEVEREDRGTQTGAPVAAAEAEGAATVVVGGGSKSTAGGGKRRRLVGTPSDYDATVHTGHVRLGWSMRTGDLQAPVGYDRWSYGLRDIRGSRVHRSRREDRWGGEPFGRGDVIGVCVSLEDGKGGVVGGGGGDGKKAEGGGPAVFSTDESIIQAFREVVEEVRRERVLRGLSTADLPPPFPTEGPDVKEEMEDGRDGKVEPELEGEVEKDVEMKDAAAAAAVVS